MKVYRIWNVTRGFWYESSSKVLWTTLTGVKNACRYCERNKDNFNHSTGKFDYFVIYEFELTNKKEII